MRQLASSIIIHACSIPESHLQGRITRLVILVSILDTAVPCGLQYLVRFYSAMVKFRSPSVDDVLILFARCSLVAQFTGIEEGQPSTVGLVDPRGNDFDILLVIPIFFIKDPCTEGIQWEQLVAVTVLVDRIHLSWVGEISARHVQDEIVIDIQSMEDEAPSLTTEP